ncbi:MAG TPA: glycosyltransferase family 4 protein [Candidatus Binataceae bacterium]|jgi:UDP-glucose:(heptosyl)LPS alpha-1,3-glucosyltransferase|nr:glycosyltransferase family 4 protein [Candidatus Binataceae bacterium]
MRIALLVRYFDPSDESSGRDMAVEADCLSRAGHEVRIYAARGHSISWHDMPVRRLPLPRLPRSLEVLGFGLLAARMARRGGADLTISFGRTADSDLIRCERPAHISYLQATPQWESRTRSTARALSPYHTAQCRMEARGFRSRRLRMVAAVSGLVGDDLARRFGIPRSKIEVLYNGVDHERFKTAINPRLGEDVRQSLGIERTGPVVLFIGHTFGREGLGKLIEAWPMLDRKPYLLVAGADRAAIYYQQLARRLWVDRRVLFLGQRDDTPSVLAAADVLAAPSLFDAFGNVVLEGMAAGLPVLTSARCGAAEVLPAPLQPFIVQDPANPTEIAQRLNALLAAPRELGQVAYEAAAQFTWEHYGDRLTKLIDRLNGSKFMSVR